MVSRCTTAGDLSNDVVQRLDVLDVDGRHHVDPGVEHLPDILPALRVARAGDVGVGEFVDECPLRRPGDHRLGIELVQFDAAVGDRASRHGFQALRHPCRLGAAMRLDQSDDDILACARQPVPLLQHDEGLAYARRRAEVDPQQPPAGAHVARHSVIGVHPGEGDIEFEDVDGSFAEEAQGPLAARTIRRGMRHPTP